MLQLPSRPGKHLGPEARRVAGCPLHQLHGAREAEYADAQAGEIAAPAQGVRAMVLPTAISAIAGPMMLEPQRACSAGAS